MLEVRLVEANLVSGQVVPHHHVPVFGGLVEKVLILEVVRGNRARDHAEGVRQHRERLARHRRGQARHRRLDGAVRREVEQALRDAVEIVLRREGSLQRDYTPFLLRLQGMALQLQGIIPPPF